jgi:hypothetical protein
MALTSLAKEEENQKRKKKKKKRNERERTSGIVLAGEKKKEEKENCWRSFPLLFYSFSFPFPFLFYRHRGTPIPKTSRVPSCFLYIVQRCRDNYYYLSYSWLGF